MEKFEWKDVSSYSRGECREIKTVNIKCGALVLTATRHISFAPDAWIARCTAFFDLYELEAKNLEDAKREALDLLVAHLKDVSDGVVSAENRW